MCWVFFSAEKLGSTVLFFDLFMVCSCSTIATSPRVPFDKFYRNPCLLWPFSLTLFSSAPQVRRRKVPWQGILYNPHVALLRTCISHMSLCGVGVPCCYERCFLFVLFCMMFKLRDAPAVACGILLREEATGAFPRRWLGGMRWEKNVGSLHENSKEEWEGCAEVIPQLFLSLFERGICPC